MLSNARPVGVLAVVCAVGTLSPLAFGDTPPDPVEDVSTAANNDPPLPHATPIVADASAVAVPPPDGVYPVPVAVLPVVFLMRKPADADAPGETLVLD